MAPKDDNKGQNKTYQITNPTTGEVREVTQRQWREEKLGKAGWQKPPDLAEADAAEGEYEGEPDSPATDAETSPTTEPPKTE